MPKFVILNKSDDTFWGYSDMLSSLTTSLHYAVPYNESNDPEGAGLSYYVAQKATYDDVKLASLKSSLRATDNLNKIDTKTTNSTTSIDAKYVRYNGSSNGVETILEAVGSNKQITYKNASNFDWTLNCPNTTTVDGLTSITLKRKQSITIVDIAIDTWDII